MSMRHRSAEIIKKTREQEARKQEEERKKLIISLMEVFKIIFEFLFLIIKLYKNINN